MKLCIISKVERAHSILKMFNLAIFLDFEFEFLKNSYQLTFATFSSSCTTEGNSTINCDAYYGCPQPKFSSIWNLGN